jgi:DNA-binding XRE family transcriptional regulator
MAPRAVADPVDHSRSENSRLGLLLRAHRREGQMTQAELARELGVQQQTVARWETGSSLPQRRLWPDVARFIGMSSEEFRKLLASSLDESQTGLVLPMYPSGDVPSSALRDELRVDETAVLRQEFLSSFVRLLAAGHPFSADAIERVLRELRIGEPHG